MIDFSMIVSLYKCTLFSCFAFVFLNRELHIMLIYYRNMIKNIYINNMDIYMHYIDSPVHIDIMSYYLLYVQVQSIYINPLVKPV